ncbi:hypothetical protein My1_071 [Pectobacterium phage My1]|uniref:Uncharacterized protein n=1 Tax=Pectobacterium phage My1 TaxID=1204539 RepID=J9QGR1_9CAUD|nr:hypothetical protein My1_071 [Pectobacterium phage My1]AFQ22230.1 hypothetical protein My1_071 [Pectobacterium phage My1]
MNYILRISGNYADEFDVMGVHKITQSQAYFLSATQGKCFNSTEEIYFGSNESVEVGDLTIVMESYSDEELEAAAKVLGTTLEHFSYGLIDVSGIIEEAMNPDEDE